MIKQVHYFMSASRSPREFWLNPQNQRKFLDQFAAECGIKNPHEWGKVTSKHIQQKGGNRLLKIHNNSVFKLLQKNYPG